MTTMGEDLTQQNDPKLKLFLRLPRDTFAPTPEDEETLKTELFRLLGDTAAQRFMPRISKGHCFLFFSSRLMAAQAHDKLSNKVVKEYPLQPVFGFTREEQQAVDAGLQNKEIERNHRTLYIKGLPQGIEKEELDSRFSQFGEIEKTNIVSTKASQVAFLVFRKFAPAHEAIEAYSQGLDINGVTATVELSKNKNLRRRVEKFQQGGGMRGGFGGPRGGFGPRGRGGWGGGYRGGYNPGWGGGQWGGQQWGGGHRGGFGGPRGGGYGGRGTGSRGGGFGRGRGGERGRGGFGNRGGYGAHRGTHPRGGYGGTPRGGGYGGGRGSTGGAYGAGRGGMNASGAGAYGGTSGGYGGRGGWNQSRGRGTAGGSYGRGGGSSWGSKSYTPY